MVFSVTRKLSGLVTPAEPTPTEVLLLSPIDRVPGLRHIVRSLHVFKTGESAAETIKQALSKALVPYYPFAGRFIDDPDDGEVKLSCKGEGVLFVEAVADCTLEDVRFLDQPLMIPADELFPAVSQDIIESIDIPFMMQVTEFTCGGFVIGILSFHTLADGLGAAQFVHAIGELARGLPKLTINPIWGRDLIPNPLKLKQSDPPPAFPNIKLQYTTIDFSTNNILQLKADFFHSTGKHCSTFDASVAKVWQSRTRAIGFEPNELVHICFFANIRHLLADILPPEGGYYGNCFYPVTVTSTAGRVSESNLVDLVKIIRDAKSSLPKEFAKWAIGDYKEDPFQVNFSYNSLFVSDWTRLGFREVDYGWGKPKPVNVIPFAYYDFMAVAIIGALPVSMQGTRVMTQCVLEKHLEEFQNEMREF
ncbi:acyl transferase 5-like [Phalaenopsis equestris]|uniref:acyl transferase 5-like n=1 Tax=Phalaenopsis equestris TaxID=78828 RepID=UPI0009E3FB8C|nr:acyl transferase 5-like [Phalaenopsis equestris]